MILRIFLFFIFGTLSGIFSGILPGIHTNLVVAIIPYLTNKFELDTLSLLTWIVSMSISHTFIDSIPSVFLGCPSQEKSLLPGHEMLKNGKGAQAIFISNIGNLIGIITISILSPILIYTFPKINEALKGKIGYILITVLIFILTKENKKIKTLTIILLTGTLGIVVLNLDIKEPLLPLLTGLFGTPLIIEGIKNKIQIPKQETSITLPNKIKKPIIISTLASLFCGFLPGIGTSQAATISTKFSKANREEFVLILGCANTMILLISFIVLHSINKTRTGIALSIKNSIPALSMKILIFILIISILSGVVSFFLTTILTKKLSNEITKINYSTLSKITLAFTLILNIVIGKIPAIIILSVATIIGIYSNSLEIRKTNMMACILIPTIWFYLKN